MDSLSPTLIWFCLMILCLLIETATVSLYGFVIALGCAVAGVISFFMGDIFHWSQLLACLVIVGVGSYFVPRIFRSVGTPLRTGLDAYIGKEATVKIIETQPKISLDGVERIVLSDTPLSAGDIVTVTGKDSNTLIVQKK